MKATIRMFPAMLVMVGLLVAVQPLVAQHGAIEGAVKGVDGNPLVGAVIVIERTDMKGRWEVKTNKKGAYIQMGLPSRPARFKLSLYWQEKPVWYQDGVMVSTGEFTRIDIDLAKERAQMPAEQKAQEEEIRTEEEKAKNLQEHFNLGLEYLKQKQYTQAISQFESAAEIDPQQYAVWGNLAQAYSGANQTDKAITAYEKAIALKPEEAGFHNNLGGLYVKAGRFDQARQAFEKAATLDPGKAATYHFNLGATLVNQGAMKEAVEPLRKALELDPNRAVAHYWLGVCLYAVAESKIEGGVVKTVLQPGTVEAFEKYLELEPNGAHAAEARANLQVIEVQVPASVKTKKKK